MPDYARPVIDRVAVDTLGWDALLAPATISRVRLKNIGPNTVLLRTDGDDSDTEDELAVGAVEDFTPYRQAAWTRGDPVVYLQSSDGNSTVVVRWLP